MHEIAVLVAQIELLNDAVTCSLGIVCVGVSVAVSGAFVEVSSGGESVVGKGVLTEGGSLTEGGLTGGRG